MRNRKSIYLPRKCGRTILRQLSGSDLDHFQLYRTDPEVARFQSWEKMTDKEALAFLQGAGSAELFTPDSWSQIGIADSLTGSLIGDVGIHINSEEYQAEIGFTIAGQYQNQGFGREAVREAINLIFDQTSVKRVIGITDERNIASIKLMRSLGMKKIARLETVFRGEACIELTFSNLREKS